MQTPRGRPPGRVLLGLTAATLALHGCLLDGVPLDLPPPRAFAALSMAPAVQVRQLAAPADRPVAAAPAVLSTPPVAAARVALAARGDRPLTVPVTAVVAVDSHPIAAATPDHAAPGPEPADVSAPASAVDAEFVPPASGPTPASADTPSAESAPLRQPGRDVPVYRTRIPPAATVDYDIRRGFLSGTGELSWRPDSGHYEARLQASAIGFTLLTQISQGGFDAAGLAPVRFTDQRARKAARAANFQREQGKITFSGPADVFALAAGSQDRLSWMIQLPAVLAAEPKRATAGGEVVLYVVGARADVDVWTLRCIGAETVDTALGPVHTVKFMRTPRSAKDTQAEVWLDPTRHYLPVRARLTQGDPDDALELVMRDLRTGH